MPYNMHALNLFPISAPALATSNAALEFAQNQLGLHNANSTEVNENTDFPLISSLSCSLMEVSGRIILEPDSLVAEIHQQTDIEYGYHYSYGVNPKYLASFSQGDRQFTHFDKQPYPRVFELPNHPFFIGTAFQPERSALASQNHPLITTFMHATQNHQPANPYS